MHKIAVFGACCTRDIFNKVFVPDWRNYFDLELYRFQPSIISIDTEKVILQTPVRGGGFAF